MVVKKELEDVLRRPYESWSSKASFTLRKLVGSRSVREHAGFRDYVQHEVEAAIEGIRAVEVAGRPVPENAQGGGGRVADLLGECDPDTLLETFELWQRRGVALQPRDWGSYAKTCVEQGDPARLLRMTNSLDHDRMSSAHFRTYMFIAALMVGDYPAARRVAANTLLGTPATKTLLLRIVGESNLLDDPAITRGAIKQLLLHFRSQLSHSQLMFIYNVAMIEVGDSFLWEIVIPNSVKLNDPNSLIFIANAAVRRGDYSEQVRQYNAVLSRYGLEHVALIDPGQPLSVVNICPAVDVKPVDGSKVTVMMSTYNSSATVIAALESLTRQCYRNLEIIVVDDGSSDDTVDKVQRYAAERDKRVQTHRTPTNGGTYRARNLGLTRATGEYFTCLDSDDWAHPRRIAALVAAVEESADRVAARSQLLRLNAAIGFKPRAAGYIQDDLSSLLFRREPVLARAGYYHQVGAGADSEFAERLSAMFGPSAVARVNKPLLLADWTEASLSGSPVTGITRGGTMSSERQRFRSMFRRRHADGAMRVALEDQDDAEPPTHSRRRA